MTVGGHSHDESVDFGERHQAEHNSILAELRVAFADRFGRSRPADAGHIVVSVLNPQPGDQQLADDVASRWGVPGRVQVVEFRAEWIDAWDQVRHVVADLAHTEPRPFHFWSTGPERREPPFEISLAAHAEAVAASLHERFGPLVQLRVGLLDFPLRPGQVRRTPAPDVTEARRQMLDPQQVTLDIDGDRTVSSGHTLRCQLSLTNHTDQPIELTTGDALDAEVLDPVTGQPVGGYDGTVTLVLRSYHAKPRTTIHIPLRVGTASYRADLGCAVPPGQWTIRPTLHLADGRILVGPPTSISIT